MKVEEFLRSQKLSYTKKHHPEAFTAQEVAAVSHVPGARMVKVVVVKAGDQYALAVCPASFRVNLNLLSKAVGTKVRLANEGQMEGIFADTELGAEVPFGGIYGIDTYVDRSLADNEEIVFQAGTHTDTISMSYADFERAAKPKVAEFAEHL